MSCRWGSSSELDAAVVKPHVMVEGPAAFAESLSTLCTAAGIRPAMAGNFSLLRQRKVTKREAPTARRLWPANDIARELALGSSREANRCALAAVLVTAQKHPRSVRLTSAARRTHEWEDKRRRRRVQACGAFAGEPGVQPALNVVKARVLTLVQSGRRERSGSLRRTHRATVFAREPHAPAQGCAVQRLFFGDFLLAQQKKVTPPPGGTPGTVHRVERLPAKATHKPT
jgi:hypothetical protein